MNILVTGAKGFVGRNLGVALRRREGVRLFEVVKDVNMVVWGWM
jgi:nucleoside-diphosphate-sugar epimerase